MNIAKPTAAALVSAALLAACGIPTDENARVVPVEVGLEYAQTPIPTTPPGIIEQVIGVVYFVDAEGELAPVKRSFETTRTRFTADPEAEQKRALAKALVEQLLAGPSRQESARGIRTFWPGDVSVLDVDITVAGTAIVQITDESRFEVSPIDEQRAASSELVFTLTELPGIEGVRLTSPTSDLRLVTEAGPASALAPVSRAQFSISGEPGGAVSEDPATTSGTPPPSPDEDSPTPSETPTRAETATPAETAAPEPTPTLRATPTP